MTLPPFGLPGVTINPFSIGSIADLIGFMLLVLSFPLLLQKVVMLSQLFLPLSDYSPIAINLTWDTSFTPKEAPRTGIFKLNVSLLNDEDCLGAIQPATFITKALKKQLSPIQT